MDAYFDVRIMNKEHVDFAYFVVNSRTCGLCYDSNNSYSMYLYYPHVSDDTEIVLYDLSRNKYFITNVFDDVVIAINHETLHMVIRNHLSAEISHMIDNVSLPDEYICIGL